MSRPSPFRVEQEAGAVSFVMPDGVKRWVCRRSSGAWGS